ncbi:MAG: heme exporter protein CcmB [Pseudomonadota bacterium]
MNAIWAIIGRDVRLGFAGGGGASQTLIFFGLTLVLFALAVGPDQQALASISGPVIWTSVLLAKFLSLDRVFQSDFEDGSLDLIVQRTPTLGVLVIAKATAHWLTTSALLIVFSPIAAILLNLSSDRYIALALSLAVGTPALSLIGTIGAALTFPMRRASALTTILVGPLYAPSLIFGVAATASGQPNDILFSPAILFLGASSLMALVVAPLAGGMALRLNMN